jgi:Dot/Icm secretion system protein IcmQ
MVNKKNVDDRLLGEQEASARQLVQSLNDLLSSGDWEATLFLKANKKKLEALRDQAQAILDNIATSKENKKAMKEYVEQPGYKLVYISIYQADPNNLSKWQGVIKGLEKHSVSRPIYAEEVHVQALIRGKPDPAKEAYIKAFVRESDILKPQLGKTTYDRYDQPLITVKEGSVKVENIVEFIHQNKHYRYVPEKGLVLI